VDGQIVILLIGLVIMWFLCQEIWRSCKKLDGVNEPMVYTGAGYFLGIHAPGKKGLNNFLSATHHAVLCQALGARAIKAIDGNANVGTTFSCSLIEALMIPG
jgi:beta-glucosidase/6-phospho-beta-glucosidase/beta-galactosidase